MSPYQDLWLYIWCAINNRRWKKLSNFRPCFWCYPGFDCLNESGRKFQKKMEKKKRYERWGPSWKQGITLLKSWNILWIAELWHMPALKGILHQKNFYRLNLIFWIVMGFGIARFGRRSLKTTETWKFWVLRRSGPGVLRHSNMGFRGAAEGFQGAATWGFEGQQHW